MLESLLVGMIVGAAIVYAVWALTPSATRSRLALRAAVALDQGELGGVRSWLAARLRTLARVPAGGCGDCSSHAATPAERASQEIRRDR